MTAWRDENEGCFWAVELNVRDVGGHLDVTLRAPAGTLSSRVRVATTQVIAVGALPMVQDMYTRLLSASLDFDSELQHVFWWEPDECRDSRVFSR